MDLGIQGKVAMVAAGSKGIGFATAKLLLAEGVKVSICSRSVENLESAKAELGYDRLMGHVADVANLEDLEAWVAKTTYELGPPGILVTNTGGPPAGTLSAMTDTQWEVGFQNTILNVVRLVNLVSPGMSERGWGRIVHLTSLVAKEPSPMLPISSTLRAGLMALTRLQSTELAPHGITVNSVLPGHTMTERQLHLAEVTAASTGITPDEALANQAARIPRGKLGEPDEVAAAIVFLCSQPAAFISGINLLADGGATKGLA